MKTSSGGIEYEDEVSVDILFVMRVVHLLGNVPFESALSKDKVEEARQLVKEGSAIMKKARKS